MINNTNGIGVTIMTMIFLMMYLMLTMMMIMRMVIKMMLMYQMELMMMMMMMMMHVIILLDTIGLDILDSITSNRGCEVLTIKISLAIGFYI